MKPVFNILEKDLRQILRDPKTSLFFIIMPIAFTFLFGWAFGGFSQPADVRLSVALIDRDQSEISLLFSQMLSQSEILRPETPKTVDLASLTGKVASNDLAAVVVIPEFYEQKFLEGLLPKIDLVIAPNTSAGLSIQNEITHLAKRLALSVGIVRIIKNEVNPESAVSPLLNQVLSAWNHPPIRLATSNRQLTSPTGSSQTNASLAHSSPGMMLQFAIAGLLTAAAVIVSERKNRCLQRLLTTPTRPLKILLGHFLALLILISSQFILLICFGQWVLRVDYFQAPLATGIVALGSALCIASLGLLIGVFAKSEEQAIVFSLIPMFILSALGGAWVPLENTGKVFAAIGRLTPVGLAMDGFKNILLRGLGIESTWLPFTLLAAYALVFFIISLMHFRKMTA